VPARPDAAHRPIRLAILDDNPFVRTADGSVHPVAALFHRFVEAVVAAGPFAAAAYLAPVRDLAGGAPEPRLGPVDARRLTVVATAPFEGIAGYVGSAPRLIRRNWGVIRDAIRDADLVWIKAPASNAPLAAIACRRAGVPRFTWVAGSARDVVRGQDRGGVARLAAGAGAIVYDATTRLLEATGPAVRLDDRLFTSVVTPAEVAATRERRREAGTALPPSDELRIAWAGRMAPEKGVDDLLDAAAALVGRGRNIRLDLLGDGAARPGLEARAAGLGLDGRVRWHGYVGDRAGYLDALRSADMFVLPSRAEGVPKVVVEAMAAGLPVVATDVGSVAAVLDSGRLGRLVPPASPEALASALAELADDPIARADLSAAGLDFAADHTIEAQAERLVAWLRTHFPALPWSAERPTSDAP
jgi:glycosyltransferase involved in cell wall biosynthesis